MNPPTHVTTSQPFIISRLLDAPRDVVWSAWTERDRLQQWFGPKGVTIPACTVDLRPGGIFHYCMSMPDGNRMWGKWTFREIVPQKSLVVIVSFSDPEGGVTRHPMSATWPLETLSTTTFEERDGRTLLTIEWSAHDPTDAERQTFDAGHDAMRQGWTGTLDQLTEYLAKPEQPTQPTS